MNDLIRDSVAFKLINIFTKRELDQNMNRLSETNPECFQQHFSIICLMHV